MAHSNSLELKQNKCFCQYSIRCFGRCPWFYIPHIFGFWLNGHDEPDNDEIRPPEGKNWPVTQREEGMIPSIKECYAVMDKYHMLGHIKAHSVVVARIARKIAHGLKEVHPEISVLKTTVGALLHDIGKTPSLSSGRNHAELGKEICLKNGFDEIAPIVAEHVILKDYAKNGAGSEKEVVFYADKRVNHHKIVTLDERLAYILERYGRNEEEICRRIRLNFGLCRQVEERLFSKLRFSPKSLMEMDGAEAASFEAGLEIPDNH